MKQNLIKQRDRCCEIAKLMTRTIQKDVRENNQVCK